MIPAKQNKIDLSKLNEEELKAFRMYGKLPANKDVKIQKIQERKYFDSGDYAMQKAGKPVAIGSEHPSPETIPHSSPITANNNVNKPVTKESNLIHTIDDQPENKGQ